MLYLDELHQSLNQRHNGLGRNTAHLRTTSLQLTGHLHHFHWTYLGTDRIVNQIWIRSIQNRAEDALIIAVQTLKKIHQQIWTCFCRLSICVQVFLSASLSSVLLSSVVGEKIYTPELAVVPVYPYEEGSCSRPLWRARQACPPLEDFPLLPLS